MSTLPIPMDMNVAWYSHHLHLTPKIQNTNTLSHLFKRNTTKSTCQSSQDFLPILTDFWQQLKSSTAIQKFTDFAFSFNGLVFTLECTLDHPPNAKEFLAGKELLEKTHATNPLGEETLREFKNHDYKQRFGSWGQQSPGALVISSPSPMIVTPAKKDSSATTRFALQTPIRLNDAHVRIDSRDPNEWIKFLKQHKVLNKNLYPPQLPGHLNIANQQLTYDCDAICRSKREMIQCVHALGELAKLQRLSAYR